MREFLSDKGKALIESEKKELKTLPQTLRILNTILRGSKISNLSKSATTSHVWRVNLVVPQYEASNPKYEHGSTFSYNEVKRLQHPHDDALVISLNL